MRRNDGLGVFVYPQVLLGGRKSFVIVILRRDSGSVGRVQDRQRQNPKALAIDPEEACGTGFSKLDLSLFFSPRSSPVFKF